ncbi:MAG: phosphotransferase [Xanthomonadales bacterium]|nr:phosphotransferase [Xanthomonadales bacterium]
MWPLGGGLTNRSFVLRGDFGKWVLRLNGLAPGIDRQREAAALDVVGPAGFGPEVIRNDPATGFLLYHFLPGQTLTVARARSAAGQRSVGRWLRRLHALDVEVPQVDAVGALNAYLSDLSEVEARPLRARFETIADALASPTDLALCHLDLVAGNIVQTPSGLKAIDWEYAGLSPPEIDLAFYLVYQKLSLSEATLFLQAYAGDQADAWRERVQPYLLLAQLLDEAWRALMR